MNRHDGFFYATMIALFTLFIIDDLVRPVHDAWLFFAGWATFGFINTTLEMRARARARKARA